MSKQFEFRCSFNWPTGQQEQTVYFQPSLPSTDYIVNIDSTYNPQSGYWITNKTYNSFRICFNNYTLESGHKATAHIYYDEASFED